MAERKDWTATATAALMALFFAMMMLTEQQRTVLARALREYVDGKSDELRAFGQQLGYPPGRFEAVVVESVRQFADSAELAPSGDWVGFLRDFFAE